MKQAELIQSMSAKEIRKALYMSQLLFFIVSIILSYFLFNHISDWTTFFKLDIQQIVYFGIIPAVIIVLFEIILYKFVPKQHFDDGGINKKVFKNQTIPHIFLIAFIVAISEELLFRGVIQTTFGYVFASSLFAVIHYRYLRKPLLFILIVLISFLIGYLFEKTGNLCVTIVFHFIVDFLLGIYIRKTCADPPVLS